ncbi:hypothetical protein T484DRAFT_2027203 [Baffinella frigidus]|nr:hypothetical protein T484DRAFT_2027203 [Cryptophyta sp. CCMP2293]
MSGELPASAAIVHPNLLEVLSRSLQDSDRQPAPVTLSPYARASASPSLEVSGKGEGNSWLPIVSRWFREHRRYQGMQQLGAGRPELCWLRRRLPRRAVRHPPISQAGPSHQLGAGLASHRWCWHCPPAAVAGEHGAHPARGSSPGCHLGQVATWEPRASSNPTPPPATSETREARLPRSQTRHKASTQTGPTACWRARTPPRWRHPLTTLGNQGNHMQPTPQQPLATKQSGPALFGGAGKVNSTPIKARCRAGQPAQPRQPTRSNRQQTNKRALEGRPTQGAARPTEKGCMARVPFAPESVR